MNTFSFLTGWFNAMAVSVAFDGHYLRGVVLMALALASLWMASLREQPTTMFSRRLPKP